MDIVKWLWFFHSYMFCLITVISTLKSMWVVLRDRVWQKETQRGNGTFYLTESSFMSSIMETHVPVLHNHLGRREHIREPGCYPVERPISPLSFLPWAPWSKWWWGQPHDQVSRSSPVRAIYKCCRKNMKVLIIKSPTRIAVPQDYLCS
jgi:hypothetical protein